jgi:hypothetical protein
MIGSPQREPEQPSVSPNGDSALEFAMRKREWYGTAAFRTNVANITSQVLLLVTGGATTVAAAVNAPVLVTASLAASAFVLTGARSVFDFNRLAVARTTAYRELEAATELYEIDRGEAPTNERQRSLVDQVNTILAEEQGAWARSRRRDHQELGATP